MTNTSPTQNTSPEARTASHSGSAPVETSALAIEVTGLCKSFGVWSRARGLREETERASSRGAG